MLPTNLQCTERSRSVESYQTENGPRQRIIMSLGKLDIPKELWKNLAKLIEAKLVGQEYIFRTEELEKIADYNIKQYLDHRKRKNSQNSPDYANIDLASVFAGAPLSFLNKCAYSSSILPHGIRAV